MFDRLQDREKNIIAGLSVGFVLILYFFLTQPTIDSHNSIKTEIKQLKDTLKKPKVKEEDLKGLQKKIDSLKYSINLLQNQVPRTEKRGFLIRDLESLATVNKIELISFTPKEAIGVTLGGQEITQKLKRFLRKKKKRAIKAAVLKTVIDIDSTGKFEDYKKLFQDIITYYRAVEIADIVITKAGVADRNSVDKRFGKKSGGKNLIEQFKDETLNVSFTLYAYTLLDQSEE